MRSVATIAVVVLFGLVLLATAIGSEDRLVRLTCWVALLAGAAVLGVVRRLRPDRLARVTLAVVLLMGLSFAGLMAAFEVCGGGALNGRVTPTGEHYLRKGGRETLVGRNAYYAVALVEMAVFVSWPVGFLLMIWPKRRRNGQQIGDGPTTRGEGGRPTRG
jgi:hypothetical protein